MKALTLGTDPAYTLRSDGGALLPCCVREVGVAMPLEILDRVSTGWSNVAHHPASRQET